MCLINFEKIEPIEDIVCYKVLKSYNDKLLSPYFNFIWNLNTQYAINIDKPKFYCNGLYGDSFHSFENLSSAIKECEFLKKYHTDSNYLVCKCTIPKSSEFVYKGLFVLNSSYASEKLIVNEIIKYK